jgi:hypothetical protein
MHSMPQGTISTATRMQANDGCPCTQWSQSYVILFECLLFHHISNPSQLISVISLLSSDKPNTDSPANVDAAKEVRTDFAGEFPFHRSCRSWYTIEARLSTRPRIQEEGPTTSTQECGRIRVVVVFFEGHLTTFWLQQQH